MARKKVSESEKRGEMKDEDKLLAEIRRRFQEAYDAAQENFEASLDDLRFLHGDQWPDDIKADREASDRPCLTINKLPTHCDQVIGDLRVNEPSIKIKPVDSSGDPETAEILQGLIRNIEVQSDAEVVYDTATESSIQCGIGAWRVQTVYASDDMFEQDIRLKRMTNPFQVYWDPAAREQDKSDARYCFVTERIARDDFEERYPGKAMTDAAGDKDQQLYWSEDKTIRIVEYWKKVPVKKTIYLMQAADKVTGRPMQVVTTEMQPDMEKLGADPRFIWTVLKQREVDSHKIVWWKASHGDILEGPSDWAGKYIPIVMVYGKELHIEGNTYYRGVVRNAKDPQRLYNYARSTRAELISLAPKAPWLVTAKMIQNYQRFWETSHKKNWPYLPYEVDKENPVAMPRRADPVGVNTGIEAEVMAADQEIRDTTGLQRANLGQPSNEKSGKAILARQKEGDIANFSYHDNLARAMKYSGKVILELIPKIYDTPRVIRVLGEDGSDKFVPVNQQFQENGPDGKAISRIYDLTVGKYDVVVSVGPSYTTQREEAAASMLEFLRIYPQAGPLIADLLAKNMDWPNAAEIEKRLKVLLPPEIKAGLGQTAGQAGGAAGAPPAAPAPVSGPGDVMDLRGKATEIQGKELENMKKFEELQRIRREGANLVGQGGGR